MKKMKLQMLGLSVNDLLSREQMKKVMGGSGNGSGSGTKVCSSYCYKGYDPDGGKHEQGHCTVPDCETHGTECTENFPGSESQACSCV